MKKQGLAGPKKALSRKDQILQAAERVFSQKGYHDATISDVAREAKVSEATIYEYFPSKEELLFSIPGETVRRGKDNLDFILRFIRSAADKIRAIVFDYLNFYQNHPDYASVSMLILKPNRKFLETETYQDIRELSGLILRVVKEGMATGEFQANLNPYLVRSAILGTMEHLVTRQVLLGKPGDLVELAEPLTDLIIGGIKTREAARVWNFSIGLGEDEEQERVRVVPFGKPRATKKGAVARSGKKKSSVLE